MSGAAECLRGDATAMAQAVRSRKISAAELVEASLARIAATNGRVNAFTEVTASRARQRAVQLDRQLAGDAPGVAESPLLGVPFAVKNLFDIEGLSTLAGSAIEHE